MAKAVSNEQTGKKLKEREQHKAERHAADIKWLLADERGRRLFWRWMSEAGVFRSSFTGNSETFFREGERNRGLKLLDDLNAHAPEAYALMQQEAAFEARLDREVQAAMQEQEES